MIGKMWAYIYIFFFCKKKHIFNDRETYVFIIINMQVRIIAHKHDKEFGFSSS